MNQIVYLVPAFGLVGLLYTAWKFNWVSKQDAGNEKMQELAGYIADGAIAFLSGMENFNLFRDSNRYTFSLVRITRGYTRKSDSLFPFNCRCFFNRSSFLCYRRLYWYDRSY